jgi:undecaprenyl pyrophosphate phosphatase UppP
MRQAIPISTHLAVTLCFLATGDSHHTIMYTIHISVPAILTIIPEVCQAIVQALKGHVKVSKKN